MTFEVTTLTGDVLATFDDADTAIVEAKQRLEDDPEMREIHVFQDTCFLGRATHVPDRHFQSVVGWLWDGERIV